MFKEPSSVMICVTLFVLNLLWYLNVHSWYSLTGLFISSILLSFPAWLILMNWTNSNLVNEGKLVLSGNKVVLTIREKEWNYSLETHTFRMNFRNQNSSDRYEWEYPVSILNCTTQCILDGTLEFDVFFEDKKQVNQLLILLRYWYEQGYDVNEHLLHADHRLIEFELDFDWQRWEKIKRLRAERKKKT